MVINEPLLLLQLLRDELRDLDIEDIKEKLLRKETPDSPPVFSSAELDEILEEPNEELRLLLIFTLFEQKLHNGQARIVQQFLGALQTDYSWIAERYAEVDKDKSRPMVRYESYRNNTTVPIIDKLNVYRREQIWNIRKHLKQLRHGINGQRYLFVYGGFGTGKWTLVSQACDFFSIVQHMGFHIFYLSLANCTSDVQILEQLENLSLQIESDFKNEDITYNGRYPTNEIYLRKKRLIQVFENSFKHSLLILSHVRDPTLIEKFDLKCKTLVVTSSTEVINKVNENERFVVRLKPGFTEDESMELFGKALLLKSGCLPPEAHQIYQMCKGNPFVVKLIARKMSEYANLYNTPSNAHVIRVWQKLAIDLSKHSITIENSTIRSILDQLSDSEQKAFRSLVIFRDNVKIPHSVLQRYWYLTAEETESLTSKLINKGLLDKRVSNQQDFFVLHYVCYSFLLKEKPGETYANLHRRLVESYSISDAFRNRTELDLLNFFPNDHYFHFYIAIHLEQSRSYDLFPDLFTDFGFLEQKVRYTGLPNTVGDLRLFQERIFTRMRDPEFYAELLTEFLMGAEVLLSKSADTCLLQLALNCTGMIAEEAKIQASQYNNRVWFCDIDHTHQHQLVQVRSAPHKVRFQDTSSALVSLDNNQISLVDLSPWYSAPATIFDGNQGRVRDMQMINNVLIALDDKGTLTIWSMKNIPQDRNARQHESDGNIRKKAQSLRSHEKDPFVSFCNVDKGNAQSDLFAITRDGVLYFYNGLSTFTLINRHLTSIKNTYMIKPLMGASSIPKLLFLTEDNLGCIFNLTSTSIECRFEEPQVVNIHNVRNGLVSVCPNQIRLRTFCLNNRNQLKTEKLEIIYETPTHHQNTCSAISDDYQYIVLGTTQGISIFSIRDHVEVLRTNISHNILDVDIYSLDDDRYRYILISSSEESGNVINMYSLMVTANNQLVSNQYQLQGNTNFLVDLDNEPVRVKTVDRKRVIQELQFSTVQGRDDFNKLSPTIENSPLASEVQQLVQCRSGFYIGLEDGDVLRLPDWCIPKSDPRPETLLRLGEPVSLLKYYDDVQLLVAATVSRCVIVIEGITEHQIGGEICECYMYSEHYLVLIYENCTVEIFNVQSKDVETTFVQRQTFCASAFNEQCLIICTSEGIIEQLGFNLGEDDRLAIQILHIFGRTDNTPSKWGRISSCALSAQGELLSIGYKRGAIEVYNTEERKLIATLESHKYEVASLYFSPWQDPNSPHILVSIGEQIVFWNLDYVINNPRLDSNDFKRRSNRYKSRPSITSPAMDIRSSFGSRSSGLSSPLAGSPARNGSFTFDIDEASLQWLSKVGPSSKSQLLSCIKLIGSAKKLMINRDFNKFFTIDDEGYLYYLRLYQPDRNRLTISFESPIRGRPANGSFLI
ncbi:uncharacterized protein LOC5567237 isoform X1 [Aedes aegypti]|uniref:Uncharacterized protein n=1 Tax=Aedes aegypti TaxID=7159 RepID=A0A6I8T422_AEDAE|nr:uncharacterized protein LOC5567237 isoform X1 [Aedes aegypti]XP_021710104.1 uncharacterized protein LOC5567237 isoform X1 [Aedes aegypti]XP_021710105.1 uncharacterized protein LOC5567237 isoform X1 [Aedes aegypti]XP_021710106.1 uncharacterized protein LOC5567237 isoform X1 [Aedes aegypti]